MSEEEQHPAEPAAGADREGRASASGADREGPASASGGAGREGADRTDAGQQGRAAGGGSGAGAGAGAGEGSGAGGGSGAGAGHGTAGKGAAPGTAKAGGASWGAHNPVPEPRSGRPRRSRTHKVAGGVCGGLGRYFDLDPVIFRVPLVVLSVVGGLGFVFYGFAWLLIPAEGETQNEGRRLLSGRVEGSSLSAVLVALVGCGLFLASIGNRSVPFSLLLVGAVAGAAYWSQHRRQAEAAGAEGAQIDPATAHAVADAPPEAQAPPVAGPASWWREPLTKEAGATKGAGPAPWQPGGATGYLWGPEGALPAATSSASYGNPWGPPRVPARGAGTGGMPPARRGARGSLGGFTLLLALLAGGIGTAAAWETHPLGTTLVVGLSCALAVFGLGLALSAFVGRTGPGTLVCVVLTAGLLAGASALPDDIATHVRETHWMPTSVAEVRPRYELGSGTGELDLSGTGLKAGQTLRTGARVGAGEIKVVVPANAVVEVRADVGMGEMSFPRALNADGDVVHDRAGGLGTNRKLTLRPFDGAKPGGTIVVKLSAGAGRVEVVRALPSGERSDTAPSSGGDTRQSAALGAGPRTGDGPGPDSGGARQLRGADTSMTGGIR
ncbi:PspC domain-containing protein [Streptomyces qinglanensis]|uniref:PspC domain-containing protein n=1 Tax=Streptomyces qinglanensis TaxID=943816 RepID=UPI0037B5B83B